MKVSIITYSERKYIQFNSLRRCIICIILYSVQCTPVWYHCTYVHMCAGQDCQLFTGFVIFFYLIKKVDTGKAYGELNDKVIIDCKRDDKK